tara:strand:+ start:387 stop:719 length:333 start_codon:yes stop_codon:yes gene_type:complete
MINNPKRIECRSIGVVLTLLIFWFSNSISIPLVFLVCSLFIPILFYPFTLFAKFIFNVIGKYIVNIFIFTSYWLLISPYSIFINFFKIYFKTRKKFENDWKEIDMKDQIK